MRHRTEIRRGCLASAHLTTSFPIIPTSKWPGMRPANWYQLGVRRRFLGRAQDHLVELPAAAADDEPHRLAALDDGRVAFPGEGALLDLGGVVVMRLCWMALVTMGAGGATECGQRKREAESNSVHGIPGVRQADGCPRRLARASTVGPLARGRAGSDTSGWPLLPVRLERRRGAAKCAKTAVPSRTSRRSGFTRIRLTRGHCTYLCPGSTVCAMRRVPGRLTDESIDSDIVGRSIVPVSTPERSTPCKPSALTT